MSEFNNSNIENAIESLLGMALKSQKKKHIINDQTGVPIAFSLEDQDALKRLDDNYINNLIAKSRKSIPKTHSNRKKRNASEQFKEAILISVLVREFSSSTYPLGRKRYQKLSYLVLRKSEYDVRHKFFKKAAGPYDHTMRYRGAETIAIKNGYIKFDRRGKYTGFVPANNISHIDQYLSRYNFANSINWVIEQFRKVQNDELELLTTVDFACLELVSLGIEVSADEVYNLIASEPEWAPKLKRAIFSLANIHQALIKLRFYFPDEY